MGSHDTDNGRLGARALIRANALFRDLPRLTVQQIVDLGYTRRMKGGEILYLQGEPGDRLYLILSGEVRISATGPEGQELHLNTLSAADVMGEIALMDGGTRTATATGTQPGVLFCIDRTDFLGLIARQPDITWQILQLLCQRVRWTSSLLEDSAFLSPEGRLAKRLLAIAGTSGVNTPEGRELRLSQSDLAGYLSLTRQVVNRMLQALRRDGILDLGRGRLVIRDADRLLKLSTR
jgi:CRP-like cAMP-binding protein